MRFLTSLPDDQQAWEKLGGLLDTTLRNTSFHPGPPLVSHRQRALAPVNQSAFLTRPSVGHIVLIPSTRGNASLMTAATFFNDGQLNHPALAGSSVCCATVPTGIPTLKHWPSRLLLTPLSTLVK